MSAVSMNVTPRSSARWIVAIDSSQSPRPYHSLIPMQHRPCAETASLLSETLRTSVLPICGWPRAQALAVDPDLGIEQPEALLLFAKGLAHVFAMVLEHLEPLRFARSRAHELGVAEHVAHGHARRPEPAQQQEPVRVGVAEAPAPVRGPTDAVQQADPLVPAQRVLRQPALLGGFPGGPAGHAIDPKRWSALQRKLARPRDDRRQQMPRPRSAPGEPPPAAPSAAAF